MSSLLGRDEIRRLEKAARDKNKQKLIDWIRQFEHQLDTLLRKDYEKMYQEEVNFSIQNFITAVAYSLYFSEENYIDKDNIADFMSDLFVTVDMFRTGEYKPEDYKEQLAEERIYIEDYDYDGIYKKFLNIFDTDLVKFLKGKYRKIVTICGSPKFREEINDVQTKLTMQGDMVFTDGIEQPDATILEEEKQQLIDLHLDKILISDEIYVINKDGFIGDITQKEIDFAKEHNKVINYLEPID